MNETKNKAENPATADEFRFQISEEPVVQTKRAAQLRDAKFRNGSGGIAAPAGGDALHLLARDPRSLFVYWDVDLDRCFATANLTARQIHLRVLREDESEEATIEIDPLAGFSFVEVSAPAAAYRCEIGCFDGEDWRTLARSEAAQTPAAAMSEDLNAEFATLPLHLSFQRLIELFRAGRPDHARLCHSVAKMQSKARTLKDSLSTDEWSQLVNSAEATEDAERRFGLRGAQPPELTALLRSVEEDSAQQNPSSENLARWRELGDPFGVSSWSGGSSERTGSFGSSSLGGSS
jgi:uncharacterized protein DUF4912